MCRRAPGATPFSLPPEAAPVPAMVEATCVPWPLLVGDVLAGHEARWPRRSGRPGRGGRRRRRCRAPRRRRRRRCCRPAHSLRGADLRGGARPGRALTLPSSQTLAMPPGQGRRRHPYAGRRTGGERGPEAGRRCALVGVSAAPWMLLQRCGPSAASGGTACAAGRRVGIGDDQRQRVGVRVVVAVGDQVGDVEQVRVEHARWPRRAWRRPGRRRCRRRRTVRVRSSGCSPFGRRTSTPCCRPPRSVTVTVSPVIRVTVDARPAAAGG